MIAPVFLIHRRDNYSKNPSDQKAKTADYSIQIFLGSIPYSTPFLSTKNTNN